MSKDLPTSASVPGSLSGSADIAGRPPLPGHGALVLLHEGLYGLPSSPDPQVVFYGVTGLLVPTVCDAASADIYEGDRLTRWRHSPARDGHPAPSRTRSSLGEPDGTSVTVYASSLPAEPDDWTGDLDYVAALTCSWKSPGGFTESAVALIKIVARYAAAIVHQGQQAELIRAQEIRIRHLEMGR